MSFAHGFPWGDTPEAGSRVLVIADGDRALAERLAESIGREIYQVREELLPRFPSMNSALDEAMNTPGLVVLADIADNAGGGAPSDNVSFLRMMLKRSVRDAAVGAIWDPLVASVCVEAGIGASLALRLGGKCGVASGEPIDIDAIVRGYRENHSQSGLGDSVSSLGLTAWIEVEGIDVIVNTIRTQVYSPEVFTGLGIPLETKKLAVVKSSQHFYTRFSPIIQDNPGFNPRPSGYEFRWSQLYSKAGLRILPSSTFHRLVSLWYSPGRRVTSLPYRLVLHPISNGPECDYSEFFHELKVLHHVME